MTEHDGVAVGRCGRRGRSAEHGLVDDGLIGRMDDGQQPEVDRYARDFELLTQIALPQDESAEFIHTIANQLRNNTTSGAL